MAADTTGLTENLAQVVTDFHELPASERLNLLLEFSTDLPDLPPQYADHPELLEPVPECQSPIFLVVEVEGQGPQAPVSLFFSAPREAPTTRGFAGILHEGLNGATAEQILDTPNDIPGRLALTELVSPLRLRGMAGMLARIKRQTKDKAAL
ncbi:cysteine desulfuration protein SufE [Kineosphaera limosa]|uniref:SufE family protein n=1 Tax=Kineosphaera limosa NBRC 100340 TaxID=1184609 RepID=K6WUI4_9MICO|nr:SufE family protein [Kineosphaera limosa]NYE00100.1 cysteine desulfuration protein SufE [Kineosphaera limosa]GAB97496.1 SufE family protein [Kineosphaera limosa NBRC 100340]